MDQLNLTLNLNVAQVNVILKYLGAGAFVEVENVINAIREQAAPQLSAAQGLEPAIPSDETVN